MPLRDLLKRFTTSQLEQDELSLKEFCESLPEHTLLGDVELRKLMVMVGEIESLRIVPSRDGTPWLEALLNDGSGKLVIVWTGRKSIAGVRPGTRLVLKGRPSLHTRSRRPVVYNPIYRLIPVDSPQS